jgi:ADP-ribosyl-[dinitrogen reductase] hydrolase
MAGQRDSAAELLSRLRGCLLGLACGDAVGTTAEFRARGSFQPVSDMTGGGPFKLSAGEWTDDTAMALCLATSLVERGEFDAGDQMDRYVRWWKEGYLSSNGRCFDIGSTVRNALGRFISTGDPFSGSTDPMSSGNGCIMRLAPVPIFYHAEYATAVQMSGKSSRTTHASLESVAASRLFGALLHKALAGRGKAEILLGFTVEEIRFLNLPPSLEAVARGAYRRKEADQIRGSRYVVESLEAALWCFHTTGAFEEAILAAANLGDDADTTAAVCGQVAGAYYGVSAIPSKWLEKLAMKEKMLELADRLASGPRYPSHSVPEYDP